MPTENKIYYVSLVQGLNGYYVKFVAKNEMQVRSYAAEYFGKLWCSVYTEPYFREILRKRFPHNTRIVNRDRPIDVSDNPEGWE